MNGKHIFRAGYCALTIFYLFHQSTVSCTNSIYRLSCQRRAAFDSKGHNMRCPFNILRSREKNSTMSCIQSCLSFPSCRGANIKETEARTKLCEIVGGKFNSKCKTVHAMGYEYYEVSNMKRPFAKTLLELQRPLSAEEALIPQIYIPLDGLYCKDTAIYTIGTDVLGNNLIKITKAKEESNSYFGKSLACDENCPFIAGQFKGHPLDENNGGSITVSFWLKCFDNITQIYGGQFLNTGHHSDAGMGVGFGDFGNKLNANYGNKYQAYKYGNTASVKCWEGWTHIAFTFSDASKTSFITGLSMELRLFVNGNELGSQKDPTERNVPNINTFLKFRKVKKFTRFAYWDRALEPKEILHISKQGP